MSWSWERRIRHIDRRVSVMEMQGLRLDMLKAEVRERRGLPSQTIPNEVVKAKLNLLLGRPTLSKQQIDWLMLRHHLLERKRAQRIAAFNKRHRSMSDTGINIARRRKEWLEMAEASQDADEWC